MPAPSEPEASDRRSDNATVEPPGLCERADAREPDKDIKSIKNKKKYLVDFPRAYKIKMDHFVSN